MHIKNYTKAQKGHILTHNENETVRSKLKNVDKELTKNNYNLCERDIKAIDYWEQRYNETKHSNQKKTTVMTDIVLTLPKDLNITEEQEKQFFKESYEFLANRYGKENVISCWVHMDEPDAQDHMHLAILPINKENRCSARGVFSKEELQSVHKDLQAHLDRELEFKCPIMNGSTANGNKTIQELKAQSLQEQNEQLQKQIREQNLKLRLLTQSTEEMKEENLKVDKENRAIMQVHQELNNTIEIETQNRQYKKQLEDVVPREDYNKVKQELEEANKQIDEQIEFIETLHSYLTETNQVDEATGYITHKLNNSYEL